MTYITVLRPLLSRQLTPHQCLEFRLAPDSHSPSTEPCLVDEHDLQSVPPILPDLGSAALIQIRCIRLVELIRRSERHKDAASIG